MRTSIQKKAVFATILGTILFAGVAAQAQIFQTVSQSGANTLGWNAAIWGTPAAAPVSTTNYLTPATFDLRTPNTTTPGAFPGTSLTISNATLYLKHNNGVATVNLILAGPTTQTGGDIIDYHGGPGGTSVPLAGSLQVNANSEIESDQSGTANENIWLQSPLSGTGNLSLNMLDATHGVLLYGTNSAYSGNWTNITGIIEVMSGSSGALGSGSVTLNFSTTTFLIFNSTNNMTVANPISGLGNVVQMNTGTVALTGSDTYTGYTEITNGGTLQIGAGTSLANSSSILLGGGTLDASLIGGLTLGASQNMNCNGTVIGGLTVPGANTLNFSFSPTTNSVLNINGTLTLDGNPNLNVITSGFVTPGTYRLINYTGTIQGGGSFTLVPPIGSTEIFALDTSTPGQVNLIVSGAVYNITWVGDSVNNNWDLTSMNWGGATNVYADGDNVTFDDTGSASPPINVTLAVHPGSVTINNTTNYYTFNGSGIVMTGSFTKTGTNEVDLTSSGNDLTGPVTIQAGILSLGNGGITTSLGTPSSITNNGILQVNMLNTGVGFTSPISGSGSLNITGGGASVTIGSTNSYTGGTTIGNGCQLNISKASALGNPASSVATVLEGGRLGVNSLVGTMSVSNPVVVSGSYVSPGGALYVNTTGNNVTWAGPITVGTGNDGIINQFRVVNVNARMNLSGVVLGTNEELECTAGNTAGDNTSVMTFNNNISLGTGGSLLVDGLAVVALDGTNVWGGGTVVGYNGTSPWVTSSTATLLVNGKLNGGTPLEVENQATLGGTGIILDPVTVDGAIAPGDLGIGTLTVNNTVTINSDGAAVFDINRTSAPNASLLSATSIICNSGTLTVSNIGTTNLQAGDSFTLFNAPLSGTFSVTNLPALPSPNMFWDTSLLASQGIIKVGSSVVPQPVITGISISGTTLILTATNGQAGEQFILLGSTNLLLPINQWTPILTNNFNGSGDLNLSTNIINPAIRQEFYLLSP